MEKTYQSPLDPTRLVETLHIPRPHLDPLQNAPPVFIRMSTFQDPDRLVDPVSVGYPCSAGLVEGFGDVVTGRCRGEVEDRREGLSEGEEGWAGCDGRHLEEHYYWCDLWMVLVAGCDDGNTRSSTL